jgi:hypothetical protein
MVVAAMVGEYLRLFLRSPSCPVIDRPWDGTVIDRIG